MSKKYCVMKKERDDIPGFRDTTIYRLECFDNKADAELKLEAYSKTGYESVYHEGYGAGEGSVDTTYYVEEIDE